MTAYLSPVFGSGTQLFNNGGAELVGGKIFVYQAGTSTLTDTWTTSTQQVKNANPIILDSTGRVVNQIWLQGGNAYKFILQDPFGNQIGSTWDNIVGINDPSSNQSQWITTGLVPTYISSTQFSVLGNYTTTFTIPRRIQAIVTAGIIYGTISASSYAGGFTTVTVTWDSTGLDSGLTQVNVENIFSIAADLSAPSGSSLVGFQQSGTGSAPSTVQKELQWRVSVAQFGAILDGVTDDSVAAQKAVNYCLANQLVLINGQAIIPILEVPGPCRITTPILIDRPDTGQWGLFRIIGKGNTGGFLTTSAINLFSSSLPGGAGTRSMLISFEDCHFGSTVMANILDVTKFDRVWINNCFLGGISLGYTNTTYLQSIYVRGCAIRGALAPLLTATDFDDVDISGNLIEACTGNIITSSGICSSFRFKDNLIESCSANTLSLTTMNGVEIHGNFSESNGGRFLVGVTSNALDIVGNYIFTALANIGQYEIQITTPNALHGAANYCTNVNGTGNLYSLLSAGGNVDIGNGDTATGTLLNTYNFTKQNYGLQKVTAPQSSVSEQFGFNNARILATDFRSIASAGGAVNFMSIGLGTTCGAAIIKLVCSGVCPGIGEVSQVAEWMVTRNGTGVVTLTSIHSQGNAGVTGATAAVSGNNIILTYTYQGAGTCTFNSAVEVLSVSGDVSAQAPSVSIT